MPKNKTVNQTLRDRTIRRAHYVEQYKNGLSRKIVGVLNDTLPSIMEKLQKRLDNISTRGYDTSVDSTSRLRKLGQVLLDDIAASMDVVKKKLTVDLIEFAKIEAQFQAGLLAHSIPFLLDILSPSPATLQAIVESRPFNGKLLSSWFDSLEASTANRVVQQVNIGLTAGESVSDIVTRLRGTRANNFTDGVLSASRREAETIVRTAANHVSTHAREETYDANSDVIDSVQLVATLDSRTTLYCMSIDGKTFPVNEGPRPPFHMGCRTTTVPVTKSWDELGIKGLKEPPPSTRASMNGQVADSTTYGDWLQDQSNDIQDKALGPERAQLFRDGEVDITRFVNDKGRTLTLDELHSIDRLDKPRIGAPAVPQ